MRKGTRIKGWISSKRPLHVHGVVGRSGPGDKLTLAVESGPLHFVALSNEGVVGKTESSAAPPIDTDHNQTSSKERNGPGRCFKSMVAETAVPPVCELSTHSVENELLERSTGTARSARLGTTPSSAHLVHDTVPGPNAPGTDNIVHRQKMRTVSQEDYLVARGANPRTGIVTPSVHSGSSSVDDQEWLRITEISQPAKWRLKDDQWISMSLDEPTPLSNPTAEANSLRPSRLLRIPPKLAHGKQPRVGTRVDGYEPNKISFTRGEQIDSIRTDRVPRGNAGEPPTVERPSADLENCGSNTIKRKPLPSPPDKRSVNSIFPGRELTEANPETVIAKKGPTRPATSSSIPTAQGSRSSRPENVGKALPALPGPHVDTEPGIAVASQPPTVSDWGLRAGDWIEDTSNRRNREDQALEKRRPCPPSHRAQFCSRPPRKLAAKESPATTLAIHSSRPQVQQHRANFPPHIEGKNWDIRRPRPPVPLRHHPLAQAMPLQPKPGHREALKIPTPNCSATSRTLMQIQLKSMSEQMAKIDLPVNAGSDRSPNYPIPANSPTPTTILQTSPEDRLISSSWREVPSPLRLARQRAVARPRPAMPQRAEGTHSVPQVSPPKEPPGEELWRMTGTSDSGISAVSSQEEGTLKCDLIPRPLRSSTGNAAAISRRKAAADEDNAGNAGETCPTKLCPNCRTSSQDAKPHNIDRVTPKREYPLRKSANAPVDLSSTSGFLQGAEDDHSSCCPRCCVMGCHGSCLGHRCQSATASTSGWERTLNAMKSSFRDSMRLSKRVRVRTSAGGSQETETEEVAELETPTLWEVGGPVSLGIPSRISRACVGAEMAMPPAHQGRRVASDSSDSSIRTYEMPISGDIAGIFEAVTVPFGATSMWLKKHPQLLVLLQVTLLKLFDMGKHVMGMMGKVYRMAHTYSKTGRVSIGKHGSLSGFAGDGVKTIVYCLILGAVAVMLGRLLAVVARTGCWLIWSLGWMVWLAKATIGLGLLW